MSFDDKESVFESLHVVSWTPFRQRPIAALSEISREMLAIVGCLASPITAAYSVRDKGRK